MQPASDRSAADLVTLLMESGLSIRDLQQATSIDRGMLSRIRGGMRTNEDHWRTLARLAVERGVVRWPANPRRRSKSDG